MQILRQRPDAAFLDGLIEGRAVNLCRILHKGGHELIGGRNVLSAMLIEKFETIIVGVIVRSAYVHSGDGAEMADGEGEFGRRKILAWRVEARQAHFKAVPGVNLASGTRQFARG